MSSNLFRISIFITGAFFFFIISTSISHAGRYTPTVCEGQSGKAFGLCRAAVASGCATDIERTHHRGNRHSHSARHSHGHRHHFRSRRSNSGSRYCRRLSNRFTRITGLDPVWINTEESESVPPAVSPEPTPTTGTTTTSTTDSTTIAIDVGTLL